MDKNFAFEKTNYILLIAGVVVILLGFLLMTGAPTTEQAYNPEIFSTRRIVVGPMVALLGFVTIIVAIMWKSKKKDDSLHRL